MARRCEISRETMRFYVAALADQEMEYARWYLMRGRPLAGWTVEALNLVWADVVRGVECRRDDDHEVNFHDLRIEAYLRGVRFQVDPVAADLKRIVERLNARSTASDKEMIDKVVRRFKERLAATPRH